MISINPTDKYLAKFQRQRCIVLLEKTCKKLFSMFRDTSTTKEQISSKFASLMKKLNELGEVYLDSEYLRAMKTYIDSLGQILEQTQDINSIRDEHMTRLNRIQKIKNATEYKKDKHVKRFEI